MARIAPAAGLGGLLLALLRAVSSSAFIRCALLAVACADATSFFVILAASNCGYIIFNFLNLNSGWIHRIDNADVPRPWRAPTWVLAAGAVLAFVNAAFMRAGAKVWNPGFDVTPHRFIAGIITERGIFRPPYTESLKAAFKD